MKPNQLVRTSITLIAIIVSVFFLENKRKANHTVYKARKERGIDAGNLKVSNTDFIFFESLSKYLFTSLIQ